jgi:hypothetical protein
MGKRSIMLKREEGNKTPFTKNSLILQPQSPEDKPQLHQKKKKKKELTSTTMVLVSP